MKKKPFSSLNSSEGTGMGCRLPSTQSLCLDLKIRKGKINYKQLL